MADHITVIPHGTAGQAAAILAGLTLHRGERPETLPAGVTVDPADRADWYVIAGLPHAVGVTRKIIYPGGMMRLEHRWPAPAPSQVTLPSGVTGLDATDLSLTLYLDGVAQATPTLTEDADVNYVTTGWSTSTAGNYSLVWGSGGAFYSCHWIVEPAASTGDARWREADEEAADALRDIYDDGEPVTVRHAASAPAEGGGAPVIVAPVDVSTHAVFRSFATFDQQYRQGSDEIWLAHGASSTVSHAGASLAGLGALKSVVAGLPGGGTAPKASGLTVYRVEDPAPLTRTDYPTPGGTGVRAWDVLRRTSEIRDAGVPVLHKLEARAA